MSDAEEVLANQLLGARLSLRNTARHLLELMQEASAEQIVDAGWQPYDIPLLEKLAEMRIPGIRR